MQPVPDQIREEFKAALDGNTRPIAAKDNCGTCTIRVVDEDAVGMHRLVFSFIAKEDKVKVASHLFASDLWRMFARYGSTVVDDGFYFASAYEGRCSVNVSVFLKEYDDTGSQPGEPGEADVPVVRGVVMVSGQLVSSIPGSFVENPYEAA